MTAYTETTFDRSIWQSVPMANWTFEITAPDRLTVTRNGETKTVRIVPDGSFVVALRQTYMISPGCTSRAPQILHKTSVVTLSPFPSFASVGEETHCKRSVFFMPRRASRSNSL